MTDYEYPNENWNTIEAHDEDKSLLPLKRMRHKGKLLFLLCLCWLLLLLSVSKDGLEGVYSKFVDMQQMVNPTDQVVSEDQGESVVEKAVPSTMSPLRTSSTSVIAKAVIKPLRTASLGMSTAGRVQEVLVREGDMVTAGQPLIRLDSSRHLVAIAQANAAIQQAEARRFELQAGARSGEIASAQAVVDAAQARLDLLLSNRVVAADEAAALAEINAAQAKLQDLYNGPAEQTLISARAEMQSAEAVVSTAQSAYNAVRWRNDIGQLPESTQLQQATINLEAARARFNELNVGPRNAEISAATAEIESARAKLAQIQTPVRGGEIDAARAELRQAKAQLEILYAGTRSETISVATAAITAAEATLLEAQISLAETILTAPFDGTIASLETEVGEQVSPGVAVLELGDLSSWQVETDDLVELDVVRVQPGVEVALTIDAMPDVELHGTVTRVKSIGESKIGDITYTVYIALDEQTYPLAWNMSATVYIAGE